jgi:hypothetical protein
LVFPHGKQHGGYFFRQFLVPLHLCGYLLAKSPNIGTRERFIRERFPSSKRLRFLCSRRQTAEAMPALFPLPLAAGHALYRKPSASRKAVVATILYLQCANNCKIAMCQRLQNSPVRFPLLKEELLRPKLGAETIPSLDAVQM